MKVEKPWGWYEVLAETDGATIKKLVINPGHRLSKQYHKHRREYLIPHSGKGGVELGRWLGPKSTEDRIVFDNQVVIVEPNHKHRIFCDADSPEPLVLIEVWQGEILDEEDNIRLEDDYDRN